MPNKTPRPRATSQNVALKSLKQAGRRSKRPEIASGAAALLVAAGWRLEDALTYGPWCWRQPETRALFRFRDALDLVKGTK